MYFSKYNMKMIFIFNLVVHTLVLFCPVVCRRRWIYRPRNVYRFPFHRTPFPPSFDIGSYPYNFPRKIHKIGGWNTAPKTHCVRCCTLYPIHISWDKIDYFQLNIFYWFFFNILSLSNNFKKLSIHLKIPRILKS